MEGIMWAQAKQVRADKDLSQAGVVQEVIVKMERSLSVTGQGRCKGIKWLCFYFHVLLFLWEVCPWVPMSPLQIQCPNR